MTTKACPSQAFDFARRARENQTRLTSNLGQSYDFIVCGVGSSGSVVARRLAETKSAQVLLIEAGDTDEHESVFAPALWPTNLGTERDWGFQAEPNPHLDGRELHMAMGKGLGGGSSVYVMVWARGHQKDWDHFAAEAEARRRFTERAARISTRPIYSSARSSSLFRANAPRRSVCPNMAGQCSRDLRSPKAAVASLCGVPTRQSCRRSIPTCFRTRSTSRPPGSA